MSLFKEFSIYLNAVKIPFEENVVKQIPIEKFKNTTILDKNNLGNSLI